MCVVSASKPVKYPSVDHGHVTLEIDLIYYAVQPDSWDRTQSLDDWIILDNRHHHETIYSRTLSDTLRCTKQVLEEFV